MNIKHGKDSSRKKITTDFELVKPEAHREFERFEGRVFSSQDEYVDWTEGTNGTPKKPHREMI